MSNFPHLFFIYLLIFFSACNLPETTKEETSLVSQVSLSSSDGQCEEICKRRSKSSFKISKACAACIESNYKQADYRFPSLDGEKIRGFEVRQKELVEILNSIGKDSTARVFALLAIGDSISTSTQKTVQVPELVFVVEKIDNATNGHTFSYYDFTRPCPNYCPDESLSN